MEAMEHLATDKTFRPSVSVAPANVVLGRGRGSSSCGPAGRIEQMETTMTQVHYLGLTVGQVPLGTWEQWSTPQRAVGSPSSNGSS